MKNVMFIVSCLMVFTMAASADVVSFRNGMNNAFYPTVTTDWLTSGYQGTAETFFGGNNGGRDNDTSAFKYFSIGSPTSTEAESQRGVIKWDLSCLAGATINSATVTILNRGVAYPQVSTDVFALLPANSAWQEGTTPPGGAVVYGDPPSTVWNYREVTVGGMESTTQDGIPWAGSPGAGTAGVDYDPSVITTLTTTSNGSTSNYQTFQFNLDTALVQSWIGPVEDNAGLLFRPKGPFPQTGYVTFISSEYAIGTVDYNRRPMLTIDYTPVPEPMTIALLGLGGLFIRRRK